MATVGAVGDDIDACVVVLTLNPGEQWHEWLAAYSRQQGAYQCIDIDSSSDDDTTALTLSNGLQLHVIDRSSFNHGGTRNLAIELCEQARYLVYMTQDAILADEDALEKILARFSDDSVAAVCGRQLPRPGASAIEAHARLYNYPARPAVRALADRERYGLKTAFISNSFAAYRVDRLIEVGGFPRDVIFGEDMYVATRLLEAGYSIAYAADARVYHSHSYTIAEEFRRYFDMGVFHAREPWIRQTLGGAESEGFKFIRSEAAYLLKNAAWRIPESLLRIVCRYAGFRAGLMEAKLPLRVRRALAMNAGYFTQLPDL